jgi:hypothetical protein
LSSHRLSAVLVALTASSVLAAKPSHPSYSSPAQGEQGVPLKDFGFLLTFAETIQAGKGSLSVIHGTDKLENVKCDREDMLFSSKFTVVPVRSELKSDTEHTVKIPSSCFMNTAGEVLAEDLSDYTFTTLTKGTSLTIYDVSSPDLMDPIKSTDSLHSPLDESWVPMKQPFVLFFSEIVQRGEAPVTITQTYAGTDAVFETIDTKTAHWTKLVFDTFIPGKVTIHPEEFTQGAAYRLDMATGAFKDKAGNFLKQNTISGYDVKVSTTIATYHPKLGSSTNVTKHTNIVLEFAHMVIKGTNSITLCSGWKPDNFCSPSTAIAQSDMHFLSKQVIINPQIDLANGKEYNVSIPSTVIKYFQGLSASSAGAWQYSFTVQSSTTGVDTGKPLLLAGLIDCDGDGQVLDGELSEKCSADLDSDNDFLELTGTVDASTPMLTSAQFKLYFRERVTAVQQATLKPDDGGAETQYNVGVGSGKSDCIATIDPLMSAGKLYTLSIGSTAIVDTAPLKNAYMGTAFHFYTPLAIPTPSPASGTLIDKSAFITLTFADTPRLGLNAANLALNIEEVTSPGSTAKVVSLTDTESVKFQSNDILVLPGTAAKPLKAGKTYQMILPKHAIRYMTLDFTYSFSTRAEDTVKPSVLLSSPAAVSHSKLSLDPAAPYVLFSEGITAVASKKIHFKEDGVVKYTIDANDASCGTGGLTTDACAEIDTLKSRVTMYPLGKSSNKAASWATAGKTYSIEIEQGAFSDSLTTGALENVADEFSFTFTADADATGPTVKNGSPAKDFIGISPAQSSVFLEFNEGVQANRNDFDIKSWEFTGTAAPVLMSEGAIQNGQRQTITLTFDTAVQASTGSIEVRDVDTNSLLGDALTMVSSAVVFAGSNVIFRPSTHMTDDGSYYVKTTHAEGIRNTASPTSSMTAPLNTKNVITFEGPMTVNFTDYPGLSGGYDVVNSSDTTLPAPVWSSIEDYTCVAGSGEIPDITLYMNEDLKQIDTDSKIRLYACGASCDTDSSPSDTLTWQLPAGSVSSSSSIGVTIDSDKSWKVTIAKPSTGVMGSSDTALTMATMNQIWLEPGLFQDFDDGPQKSKYKSMPFAVCEVKYDTTGGNLVRLYSLMSFSTSSSAAAKKFEVTIPTTSVKDVLGNAPAVTATYAFRHESELPTLDASNSNPSHTASGAVKENIVLAFNEVVQAGEGSFEIWKLASTDSREFSVGVSKLTSASVDGHNIIAGSRVSITPKTLCDGDPACGDLVSGTTYYLKTTEEGTLRDVVGNKLPVLNTRATWKFSADATDFSRPKVAFASGTEFSGLEVTGYIFFSEEVEKNTGSLSIIDCGTDLVCNGADDASPILSAALSFGDGSSTDGTTEYGLLRYVQTLPLNNRKYKISVPTDFVKDKSSPAKTGPSSAYSFYVEVGSVSSLSADSSPPTLAAFSPSLASTMASESTDITLHFNEDVQKGTGTITFCTNSDAEIDGLPACAAAVYASGGSVTFDVASSSLDRRNLTLDLTQDLKFGQTLYMLMPAGLVKDATISSNAMAVVEKDAYYFTVTEQDTVNPVMHHHTTPTLTSGSVVLYFSEAVQATTLGGANITQSDGADVLSLKTTVSGNKVTITRSDWTAGIKYRLDMDEMAFTDIAGNSMTSSIDSQEFTISSDTIEPTATLTPANGATTVDQYDTLAISFSEVVQKGTGKVSIYSKVGGCTDEPCTGGTMYMETDVMSLPLIRYTKVMAVGSKAVSETVVEHNTKLTVGTSYALRVPTTAFKDLSGNMFMAGDAFSNHSFTITTEKDNSNPSLLNADLGLSPNPAFTQSHITLYFSEAVQFGAGDNHAYMKPSSGGTFCVLGQGGICPVGEVCTGSCQYESLGSNELKISAMTISGAKVTARVPILQAGYGYKLAVDAATVKDIAGHTLDKATDGDSRSNGNVYTVQHPAQSSDVSGPVHMTVGQNSMVPNGTPSGKMIPPSTTVRISFNEVVQAGVGTINLLGSGVSDDVNIPVSDCTFESTNMVCDPPGHLDRNTIYSVTYLLNAVQDTSNNNLFSRIDGTNTKLEFTTIDLDYNPPMLAAATGKSFARRLEASPFDPTNGAATVAKGTLIALTFSETVQAGDGNIVLTPGTGTATTIPVDGISSSYKFYYSGKTVYLDQGDLTQAQTYSVTTSVAGTFKDVANQPLAKIGSGWSFTVVTDDTTIPTMVGHEPQADTSAGDDSPTGDITLFFSEAVQTNGAGKTVTVSDGVKSAAIPVDNADPTKGTVTILGANVRIDPFDDLGYDKTVTVSIATGAFKDLFGLANGVVNDWKYKTSDFSFATLREHNETTGFPPREGAVAFWTKPPSGTGAEILMLYGGRTSDGVCTRDIFTSTTGATWKALMATSTKSGWNAPNVSNAPSAMDADGCVWLLGGECEDDYSNTIWKSCTAGSTWTPLPKPAPEVPDRKWPDSFYGHAITILGGWQLVLVDSVRGMVWAMSDKKATIVKLVTASLPFARRQDPILVATSDTTLYLMGGHNCIDPICATQVFTDVWSSGDGGATWVCQTANYAPELTEKFSLGIGRFVTPIMAYDNTIFLVGGHKPNTTLGLDTVYESYGKMLDTAIAGPLTQLPAHDSSGAMADANLTFFFGESIQAGVGSITLTDYGPDDVTGGTTGDADTDIPITTVVSRQILSVIPGQSLKAGRKHGLTITDGAFKDIAGNTLTASAFGTYNFKVVNDDAKPTVVSTWPAPQATGIEPWASGIVLIMNEAVQVGNGKITIKPSGMGAPHEIDVASATIVDSKAFFPLPTVGELGGLTQGAEYSIHVPTGLLMDLARNPMDGDKVATFTVMSGSVNPSYSGAHVPSVPTPAMTGSDLYDKPPKIQAISPGNGVSDVPITNVSLLVTFNEPVLLNQTGFVVITNSSKHVVARVNISQELPHGAGLRGSLIHNGFRVQVPNGILQNGKQYVVDIPAGLAMDTGGHPSKANSTSFRCLAGHESKAGPEVLMLSPINQATGVSGSLTTISIWFSEDIAAVDGGSITVRRDMSAYSVADQSKNGWRYELAVTGKNATKISIVGARLNLLFSKGQLDTEAGKWLVEISAGAISDESRGAQTPPAAIAFAGLSSSAYSFKSVEADTTKPLISTASPEHEASPTYSLPTSLSVMLTFNEAVQASQGFLRMRPKFHSKTVAIDVQSESVTVVGSQVVVAFETDLMPGEAYGVTVDANSFADVAGNPFDGLQGGHTISTAALLRFTRSGSFAQERYSASVAIDRQNNLFLIGGHNGTEGYLYGDNSTEGDRLLLNDVLRLDTYRPVHCASSHGPKSQCYSEDGTPQVQLECHGNPPTLGKATSKLTVWRAPSAGGMACVGPGGMTSGLLGDVIGTREYDCPCPICIDPPAPPLPKNMIDNHYVARYTYLSSGNETRPLLCAEGFKPSGSFVCGVDTPYIGKFKTPYPQCMPEGCIVPAVPNGTASCGDEMVHKGNCSVTCMEGYVLAFNTQSFTCEYGKITQTPLCVMQTTVSDDIAQALKNGTIRGIRTEVYVKGDLTIDLVPPENMTLAQLVTSSAFQHVLRDSLAVGLFVKPEMTEITSLQSNSTPTTTTTTLAPLNTTITTTTAIVEAQANLTTITTTTTIKAGNTTTSTMAANATTTASATNNTTTTALATTTTLVNATTNNKTGSRRLDILDVAAESSRQLAASSKIVAEYAIKMKTAETAAWIVSILSNEFQQEAFVERFSNSL